MLRTLNCTGCTVSRAVHWGDHMHHENAGMVIAGWCGACKSAAGGRPGSCLGVWLPQLGLTVQIGRGNPGRIMVLREEGDAHHGLHELQ